MLDVYLRKAEERDVDLLFRWANDESVRQNSFHTEPIPYEDHKKWYAEKLKSNNSIIYIYYSGGESVGQVRVDVEGNIGTINYSIDGAYRSQGHGKKMLSLVEATAKEIAYNNKFDYLCCACYSSKQ